MQPNATAEAVLKQLFTAYATAAEKAGVTRTNRTPEEIVIIASLVEAEARNAEDFGKVARVVYNRLEQGMPLQFDSTVNYALKADKQIVTNAGPRRRTRRTTPTSTRVCRRRRSTRPGWRR